MFAKAALLLPLLASAAYADFPAWQAAGPDDSRAPCPGLNAMANHGILPHDGKNINVSMLADAMRDTFHFGFDIRTVLAIGGVLSSGNADGYMELANLDKHNFIEHDGSLSRAAIHSASKDDHTFAPALFNQAMAYYPNGTNATTSITGASAAHLAAIKRDSAIPDFSYGIKQHVLGYAETSLYLMTMADDPTTGQAPLKYVKILFEEERLPWNEGWRTPPQEINFAVAGALQKKIAAAGGEAAQEGIIISQETTALAMLGFDPSTVQLTPFVQGLLRQFGLGDFFGTDSSLLS